MEPDIPHYQFKDEPNKVQDFLVLELTDDPLLGYVAIDTDHGRVVCAVNRSAAQMIVNGLTDFLNGDAEKFTRP